MKFNLPLAIITAFLLAASLPPLSAASNVSRTSHHAVSAVPVAHKKDGSNHLKKEKRKAGMKKWQEKKAARHFQKSKFVQRLSLGFVGFIVMIVGGMFIVLGIVIPYLGILFLVIGIIIAFVGLLLWVLLSKVGVRVSSGDGRDKNAN